MFIRNKKGELITPFIIKLIVAVILIILVISFGAKIWGALFPNGDKSSLKSLEMTYNLMKSQSASTQDYSSLSATLYLKDDYRIIFFDTDQWDCAKEEHWYGNTQKNFFAPKACETGKQCICLYEDTPSGEYKDKDKSVIKCYSFEGTINVDHERFDLNKVACDPEGKKLYTPYLFIKTFDTQKAQSYIYVVEDNDTNKELAKEWSRVICRDGMDKSGFCLGQKDGTVMYSDKEDTIKRMYDYCQNKDPKGTYKVTTIKCSYDAATKTCDADCFYSDITKEVCANTYKTCESFNENIGIINHINMDTNTKDAVMCKNPDKYCSNVGACDLGTKGVYTCKKDLASNGEIDSKSDVCAAPPGLESTAIEKDRCKIVESYELGTIGQFIESYDDTDVGCKLYMDENFYSPVPMMVCKPNTKENPDNLEKCQQFLLKADNFEKCELKDIRSGSFILLLHYDREKCPDVDDYFITPQFCSAAHVEETQ